MKNSFNLNAMAYRLFYCLLIILFLWIFILNVSVDISLTPVILFLSSFLFIGFIFFKKFWINKSEIEKKKNTIYTVIEIELWILLFIFVTTIGLSLRVTPSWDYDAVHRYALEWVRNGFMEDTSYFSRYPNNNLILAIITIFYKCVYFFFPNGTDEFFIKASIVFNSLFVTLSIYFTSLAAQKLYGKNFKWISVIFLAFFTPIFLYTEILYTDTIGIFFVALISFMLINKMSDFNILDMFIVGILFSLGYKIKAFIIIILVALVITLLLKNNVKFIKKSILIFTLVMSFLISSIFLGIVLDRSIGLNDKSYDQYQFPTSHWIMMSLNPKFEGGFNQDDYIETRDTDGMENKKVLIDKKINDRLNSMGTSGTIEHMLYKKMKRTWTVGSMAIDDYANRGSVNTSFMQDFFTIDGKNHSLYSIYSQATHLLLIFLILINGLTCLFKQRDKENLINISIFGIALFLIIWECNSRYLFSFIPLLSLSSMRFLAINYKNILN